MRGSRSRTTGGSWRLRLSSTVRRARSGRTTVTSSPSSAGPNARRTGRCCRRSPVSSISPRRAQHQVPVVLAERDARRHHRAHARVGGDGEPDLRGRRRRGGHRPSVACGRTSSSEIAAGTPSTLTRGAPARSCINPWSLPGESTPRAAAAGLEQRVDAAGRPLRAAAPPPPPGWPAAPAAPPSSGVSAPSPATSTRPSRSPSSARRNR